MAIQPYDFSTVVSGYNFKITRQASDSAEYSYDAANSAEVTYTVVATTDDAGHWPGKNIIHIALYQAGVAVGARWVSDALAVEQDDSLGCRKISLRQTGRGTWTATCSYGVMQITGGGGDFSPIDLTPTFDYGTEFEDIPFWKDFADQPVINAAGDRFATPLTYPYPYTVLTVTRNELAFDAAYANLWKGKANDGVWNGYAAGYVCLKDVSARYVPHPQLDHYWNVTYVFFIKEKADETEVLNSGYRYKPGGTGAPRRLMDAQGQPSASDILLASDGDKLGDGGTPVFLSFKTAEQVDFTPLDITIPS